MGRHFFLYSPSTKSVRRGAALVALDGKTGSVSASYYTEKRKEKFKRQGFSPSKEIVSDG